MFAFIDNISGNKEKQHNGKVLVQIKAYALKRTGYTLLHDELMTELNEEVFSQPIGIKLQMQIKTSAALIYKLIILRI